MIYSAVEFVSLRSSDVKSEYDKAAHDEAPVEVWNEVIDKYPEYRKWVAHNKTVPLEILEKLCMYDAEVRYFVATKRKLSPDLFLRLSKDADSAVRQKIAANKKTPIDILRDLVMDVDEDVAKVADYNLRSRK